MTQLEEKVYRELIKTMALDESALGGFDENSPIFGDPQPGQVSMNLDSVDSLELLVMIEKEWGLPEIPIEDMTRLTTVKEIAAYVTEHLQKGEET
ncbi:MAG: acyl carrier protein [Selenomonadaceae bacterium]|nr:acyl carrier protein [Selenomonadaceae bacterium]